MKPQGKKVKKTQTALYPVVGMSCASCAAHIGKALSRMEGVHEAVVNFAGRSARIAHDESVSPATLQDAVQRIGYRLIVDAEDRTTSQERMQRAHAVRLKRRALWAALFTLPVFVIGMAFADWRPGRWISMALAVPVMAYAGKGFFVNAWRQARRRNVGMDTLVALSTGIAFLFSLFNTLYPGFWLDRGAQPHVYYEAATVIITFVLWGRYLEEKATSRASSVIKKLLNLRPKTVRIIVDGKEHSVPVAAVQKGDRLLVRPGEKVAVDGVVAEGSSYVDESSITGEATPAAKTAGAKAFAGTVNQRGSFILTAEKVGHATLLAQVIKAVQEAQDSRPPVQKWVDRVAAVFVPAVMGVAALTFVAWMVLAGEDAFAHAVMASVAVLVVACPCALGLATPTAIMVGIGKGAANRILIRDAESLEQGHKVNAVVMDKTGTLTEGKPVVVDMRWTPHADPATDAEALLALASRSAHPLAEAIAHKVAESGASPAALSHFESLTGRGARASGPRDRSYVMGSAALLHDRQIALPDALKGAIDHWQREAYTVVYFADDKRALAAVALADKVRDGAAAAIKRLAQKGVDVYMLTGDNERTARSVARQVGISLFKGGLLPADKADFVKQLQQQGRTVAMVGDGVNDAQALAQADVGMAMGQGADIAIDVAKITLITSDLEAVPKALTLSTHTVRGIRENLFWAFIYNIIGIPLAAGVLYPVNGFLLNPMAAGIAMAFSSVSVVANSLRLRVKRL